MILKAVYYHVRKWLEKNPDMADHFDPNIVEKYLKDKEDDEFF